jgi:nucleoside-diphosphate-sugar epimerase
VTGRCFLVTGGSGFLGINLVRFLLGRGHAVRSLDIAPFAYPERDRIEAVQGDIRDRGAVDRAVAGVDVVFHCAAALPLYGPDDITSSIAGGTRTILESAVEHGVPRVVYISSTAVYGIPDHHPLREDDRLQGVGPYGKAKIQAEQLCRAFRDRGLCVPILRAKTFVGPERLGVFAILYEWASEGRNFPMIGSGANRYQLLDVEDLCEASYLCATLDATSVNHTFNVGADQFTTFREDFQAVLDCAGHGKRMIAFPARPTIWVLRLLEALGASPLYQWVYETAFTDSYVSTDRIRDTLGFGPKYSNKDALVRNYRWYVEHRDDIGTGTGVSHRVPWKQGVLRLAKALF